MKSVFTSLATVGLAFFVSAPASAATTDPEIIIYRGAGFRDGGAASRVTCTPFSGVTENIRFVIRDGSGALFDNFATPVAHLNSVSETGSGGSGGTFTIAATSNQVVCTASAGGATLHMIRFNPISGTTE